MKYNQSFFDQLLVSPQVEALVMEPTKRVAAAAQASAPVDEGDYKRGIVARSKRQKRVVGIVQATDEKSMLIEARTGNLVRALRSTARGGS